MMIGRSIAMDSIWPEDSAELAELPQRLLELELAGRLIRLADGRLQRVR